MKSLWKLYLVTCAGLVFSTCALADSTITYQGRVHHQGQPYSGNANMEFRLFNDETDGAQVGPTISGSVAVSDGLFKVELDFGSTPYQFARWLQVTIDDNDLSPRQQITGAPIAVRGGFGFASGTGNATSGGATALGLGTMASAEGATALGIGAVANAEGGSAIGTFATASGERSTALGYGTTASALRSTALGSQTTASGAYSTAMGDNTTASGNYGTAMGRGTIASGFFSTAMGVDTVASGQSSIATGGGGEGTIASGTYSVAMGHNAQASEWASVALGGGTRALNVYSTSLGLATYAGCPHMVAMGRYNTIQNCAGGGAEPTRPLLVVGSGTSHGQRSNALYLRANGNMTIAGSLTQNSDRNNKQDILPLDPLEILEAVNSLKVSSWRYIHSPDVLHIGPMAQDFHETFGVGEDETGISTLDASGVALAAVQGLHSLVENQRRQMAALEHQLALQEQEYRRHLAALEAILLDGTANALGDR